MVVCKVEVGETGQPGQGVRGQGDDGVVGQVEGGEGEQPRESPVLHLLHSIALQAESGQAGEGDEGVAGEPADGVEGEVEGAKVGGEEVKGGRGEGALEEVAREVERGEVGEVLKVVLVDRPCGQLVGCQLKGVHVQVSR